MNLKESFCFHGNVFCLTEDGDVLFFRTYQLMLKFPSVKKKQEEMVSVSADLSSEKPTVSLSPTSVENFAYVKTSKYAFLFYIN